MTQPTTRNAPPSTQSSTDTKRRRFLLALGAGSASAAAAAVPIANAVDATEAAAPESKGYRETEHVRDYYATTRL
jgi:H+/Cl- antiporter ClcA